MIGYYVHHVGRGHLHQALAIATASSEEYMLMSSAPRPAGYQGHWLQLPRDDDTKNVVDPTAGGQLHWAPLHSSGLRDRMGAIAQWIQRHKPTAFVVDVSVEVSMYV